jgi:O-antigen/teichoic acid export membrane protein
MNDRDRLKIKTVWGVIWSLSSTLGKQFIQLLIQIVLARLLMPEDFGIIGMVTIFITISQVFIDSGFTNGLIRDKDSTQEDYSTIFFFNLMVAGILYLTLFASAGQISNFYGKPELVNLIRVLSLVLVINAFGLIQRTILIKSLNFKAQMKIDLVSSIVSGIIGIIFALFGLGVWSLVIRTLIMQLMQSVLLSLSNRWSPSLVFSTSSFKKLFSFGWKLLVSTIISRLYDNIYYLIIGRVFSAVDLGFYTNARKLKDTAADSITSSIQNVSFPVLSNIQNDAERLKRGYQKIIRNTVFITFPLILGLAAVAKPLFIILLGEKWLPAIPYFQIMCLSAQLNPLQAINLNMLQVKGRSDLFLKAGIYKRIIFFTSIGIVVFLHMGITALLWTSVINSYIAYIINTFYSRKLVSYSILEQIKDIKTTYIIAGTMALVTYSLGYILKFGDLIILVIQINVGVVFYIVLSFIFKVEELTTIYNIINPICRKLSNKGYKNIINKVD